MLIHSGTGNATSAAALFTTGRPLRVSLVTTDATEVTLEMRDGESGSWVPIMKDGVDVVLSATNPIVALQLGPCYLRGIATGNTGTAWKLVAVDV